jgi:hypothetical protein
MRILFKKPFRFANNGYVFDEYMAGQEYEVNQSCADSALQEKVAKLVAHQPVSVNDDDPSGEGRQEQAPQAEQKALFAAPENKAVEAAAENK